MCLDDENKLPSISCCLGSQKGEKSSQENKHISDFKLFLIVWFSWGEGEGEGGKIVKQISNYANRKKEEEIPDSPQPILLKSIKLFTKSPKPVFQQAW